MVIEIPGYSEFERVGAGASGVVYRAHQLAFGDRVVAVKVIPDSDVDETTARRFRRECLSAGKLSWHPNVVSVYDAGITEDGLAFLVMEYLESGSLADRLRARGAVPWHQAVDTAIRVAGALGAAHAAGLVHRDVKPENILIGPFGEPKLGDFGIAFIEGRSRSRTGSISGTIAHSAPEALAGNATESADIYALGSTLYTLLAGSPAFVNSEDHSITPMIARIATASLPDLRPRGVPDSLGDVIEKAMAKAPEDRWPSALAFGEALQDVERKEAQSITPLLVAPERSTRSEASATGVLRESPEPASPDNRSGESSAKSESATGGSPDSEPTVVLARAHEDEIDLPTPGTAVVTPSVAETPESPSERGPEKASPHQRLTARSLAIAGAIAIIALVVLVVFLTSSGDDAQSRLDLTTGDCFDGSTTEASVQVVVVDCTKPHDAEVVATVILGDAGDSYPGSVSVERRARAGCADAVDSAPSGQTKSQVFPNEQAWLDGSRLAVCMLSASDGEPLPGQ